MNRSVENKDHVLIARVVGVHGIKGTNKIRSYAESLSLFESDCSFVVRSSGGRNQTLAIEWVKPHTGTALIKFHGIDNRSQAEDLVGDELFIARQALPDMEDDAHFWFDLIGMAVYTAENEYLGQLESIIETGSNDVYVVQDGKREVLIPALESVVLEVDIKTKRMLVELPEGLI